jgi:hypothetical protein
MKRLSCILGVHEVQHQTRHEIIAETRFGWIWRIRHFEECSQCGVTTPGRIQYTYDLDNSFSQPSSVGREAGFCGQEGPGLSPVPPVSSTGKTPAPAHKNIMAHQHRVCGASDIPGFSRGNP